MLASRYNVRLMLFCSLLLLLSTAAAGDVTATPSAPKDFYSPPTPSTLKPPITTPAKPYTQPTTPSVSPPNLPVSPVVSPPVTPYPPKAPTPSVGIKPPVTPYPPKSPSPIIGITPPVASYPPKGPSPPVAPYPPKGPSPPVAPYPPKGPSPPSPTPYYGSGPPVKKAECAPLCGIRCAKHSRLAVCMRACSTCCIRCKCVPPGTYGNKILCGRCYTDMTTHGGRLKCP